MNNLVKPVDRSRLYDQIAHQLQGMIDEGQLKPGDKLPSERDLAAQFAVSRNTVRDAFHALEAKGLIEIRQGDGTYVRKATQDEVYESIISILVDHEEMIREIIQVRLIVEPGIAYHAAQNSTPEYIQKLEEILSRHEEVVASGDPGVEEDAAFHHTITEMTGNRFLVMLLDSFDESFTRTRGTLLHYAGTSARLGHRRILEAIGGGEPVEARNAMLAHIEEVLETYEYLEANS